MSDDTAPDHAAVARGRAMLGFARDIETAPEFFLFRTCAVPSITRAGP